ncbi:hypothetical protein [Haloarcula sebkhae]|uniref:Uncharacterized protein n=1 Tax=Haloarcula sebkhae TaxID=932660 RepID=A0ACC6VIR0_9EURY|nr:hypothetical protein [Haloarcula sebkhae]
MDASDYSLAGEQMECLLGVLDVHQPESVPRDIDAAHELLVPSVLTSRVAAVAVDTPEVVPIELDSRGNEWVVRLHIRDDEVLVREPFCGVKGRISNCFGADGTCGLVPAFGQPNIDFLVESDVWFLRLRLSCGTPRHIKYGLNYI